MPGFADLQRMAMLLLSERVGDAAEILLRGADGGLELKAFAEARPYSTLGSLQSRVRLHEG